MLKEKSAAPGASAGDNNSFSMTPVGLAFALVLTAFPLHAAVSPEEAAKLGKELTQVGAERAGNKDGTIPEWLGGKLFSDEQKAMTAVKLEKIRTKENPRYLEDTLKDTAEKLIPGVNKPLFTIDKNNLAQYESKLTEGHKGLFKRYADYKMIVYPSVRPAYFPDAIYAATLVNATKATLTGTDIVKGAKLGFPFPIPKSGAEPLWNHKLKFRGGAVKRYNNQAIVKPDGTFKISKLVEDVKFKYANLNEAGGDTVKLFGYYLSEVISPPRVAGQLTLVHESAGTEGGGRIAYIFSPGLGRTNRAPDVGYDNPYIGSDGEQFNDQVDVFNGAQDRYNWKLIGKKEMYIAYNSYSINSWTRKYTELIKPGHINQDLARYELHRVWIVEADLKPGTRHQFKKRRFYLDEDSWSIAVVDAYDNRDQLWKVQEAHLLTVPFIPTTTGIPELIYDLQSGRYFATTLVNEDPVSDFNVSYKDDYFSPSSLQRKARSK